MRERGRPVSQGWVTRLIVINVIIYFLQALSPARDMISYYGGLVPSLVAGRGYVWQLFTYMFLHGSPAHIFFNMYALLIFGIPIEQTWGGRRMLLYYLFCGVGAGVSILVINLLSQGLQYSIPTIGASGAVFGVLLAFGVLYPDVEILLFFILPIKAKYLVILYGLLELYMEVSGGSGNISHVGHLGGLFFGLVYFYLFQRSTISFKSKIARARMGSRARQFTNTIKQGGPANEDRNRAIQKAIITKLKTGGYDSLSDDEVQYIKYLQIMLEKKEKPDCRRIEYSADEPVCMECKDRDLCFLDEVEKHTKN